MKFVFVTASRFLVTLLIATFVVFGLLQLIPGDPATAIAGENATAEQLAQIRSDLGLDKPLVEQYVSWLGGVVQGDFGSSLLSRQPVIDQIVNRLPVTLQLVGFALVLAAAVGIPAGVVSARHAGRVQDRIVSTFSAAGLAIPNFWLGMILISIFSLGYGFFPATGFRGLSDGLGEFLRYGFLPAIAIGAAASAEIARQLRGSLLDVLSSDYIRTARSKGLLERRVVWVHGFRNAGVVMVTIFGLLVNRLVGATVVVEAVFAIPGAGSMVVDAVRQRDYPLIQGTVFVMAVIVLTVNLVTDLLYRRIDPRIR